MSPFTSGMLGLPCQPCWRPWQLKFGSHDSGGPEDGTFASQALPHLLIPGFLRFTSVGNEKLKSFWAKNPKFSGSTPQTCWATVVCMTGPCDLGVTRSPSTPKIIPIHTTTQCIVYGTYGSSSVNTSDYYLRLSCMVLYRVRD